MRLVTRADFDGLICGALLEELGVVNEYLFVHPKDVQDGIVPITKKDVLANVPFDTRCGLWFDHHSSELERSRMLLDYKITGRIFEGCSRPAPSCARVIFDHYGGGWRFDDFRIRGVIDAADKSDTANFSIEEILYPSGWVLLSFILDPRTGLWRHDDFKTDHITFFTEMIGHLRSKTIDEILELPAVKERIYRYMRDEKAYEQMVRANSYLAGNVLVIDLRGTDEFAVGNRFVEFALFPRQNVSLRVFADKNHDKVIFAVGHSITNRTCKTNVGSLMLKHGGGGHFKVGTTQAPIENASRIFKELLAALKE